MWRRTSGRWRYEAGDCRSKIVERLCRKPRSILGCGTRSMTISCTHLFEIIFSFLHWYLKEMLSTLQPRLLQIITEEIATPHCHACTHTTSIKTAKWQWLKLSYTTEVTK
jgi:hypothetical protein